MDNNQNIGDQIIQKYKKRGDSTVGRNPGQKRKNHNVSPLLTGLDFSAHWHYRG